MKERITPEQVIAYHTRMSRIAVRDIGVAGTVIASWIPHLVRSLAEKVGGRQSARWLYGEHSPLYGGSLDGVPVSVAHLRVGAPATVMTLEELIACGARQILCLGYAGSLQPSAPVGSLVVPTGCVCDEGTSRHYVEAGAALAPDKGLEAAIERAGREAGVRLAAGAVWSTDAPYREFVETIEEHRGRGVVAVDMETSAVFAVCRHRGVRAAVLLVVSDELWHEWRPAFGSPELDAAAGRASEILLSACRALVART